MVGPARISGRSRCSWAVDNTTQKSTIVVVLVALLGPKRVSVVLVPDLLLLDPIRYDRTASDFR